VPIPGDASLAAVLVGFLDELRSRHSSPSYVGQAEQVLSAFLSHLNAKGIDDVRAVKGEDVAAWLRELRGRTTRQGAPLSLRSQHDYLAVVRVFFAALVKRGRLFADPVGELCVKKPRGLPRAVLSEAEARRLVQAPLASARLGARDRAILETLYATGIRASECAGLELSDLDLGAEELLVRDGKGRKDRLVPLVGRARKAIARYLQDSRRELLKDPRETTLFLSRSGRRLGVPGLRQIVRTAAGAARIGQAVTTHALRHTCATELVRGGADIRHVQELLGHRSVETTAVYTRVAVEDLRRVMARCHPRGRRNAGRSDLPEKG
jgi:integrase/recombinase XerD